MNNIFGKKFCITTWGESHGKAVGVVIDGVPANIKVGIAEINEALEKRAPGRSEFTSPRKESDSVEIMSGMFNGKTTGTPISLLVKNRDADSSKYEVIKNKFRPGHADYTYTQKYKNYDYRGGGRASARETVGRVAASVFAKKILEPQNIIVRAYLQQVGDVSLEYPFPNLTEIDNDPIFCPDMKISKKIQQQLIEVKQAGNSIGGIVAFDCQNVPVGLGEPVYNKLEAALANAMLSIPASKGFEIGLGFTAATMTGKQHNDEMLMSENQIYYSTNNSGGISGGISNGDRIYGRVAFKPSSSILQKQSTVDDRNNNTNIELPKGSKHDPCVAIRGVKVVEAMCYLVLADFILL